MEKVTLSLVAHTNVGKTTLARTLLKKDVGEVRDMAHVTTTTEEHLLIEVDGAKLVLWDTPGFGDTARLVRRLKTEQNPIGWFMHQVWDRWTNRTLWCSQQAVKNVQEEADVVLYLVDASQNPEDAGYLLPEFEILTWIGRPVAVVLNQTGTAQGRDLSAMTAKWREFVQPWKIVGTTIILDAFSRCWIEEGMLLGSVGALLTPEKKAAMERLRRAWDDRNRELFARSIGRVAGHIARVARSKVLLTKSGNDKSEKKAAMETLARGLEASLHDLMNALIADHGLDGRCAVKIDEHLKSFVLPTEAQVTTTRGAIIGGVVSGALTGLVADVLSGGLTFGGGFVAGAIGGALAGAGLARGYRIVKTRAEPAVSWSPEALFQVTIDAVTRYLAVSHFGRGRGGFQEPELSADRVAAVREETGRRAATLDRAFKSAIADEVNEAMTSSEMIAIIDDLVRTLLRRFYPSGAAILG